MPRVPVRLPGAFEASLRRCRGLAIIRCWWQLGTVLRLRLLAPVFIAILTTEVTAWLGLALLGRSGLSYRPISMAPPDSTVVHAALGESSSYIRHDAHLGWSIRPLSTYRGLYHATADGLRAPSLPSDTVAFGDSFTHGDEVPDSASWAALLRVRNYGVRGYGLDQSLLRYLEERPLARVVLIGFTSENIYRTVSVYRPFYYPNSEFPFTKPRFRLTGDSLTLLPNPLSGDTHYSALLARPDSVFARIGESDWYWRTRSHESAWDASATVRLIKLAREQLVKVNPYDPESEAFRITVALFEAFVAAVRANGADPIVLIFPMQADLEEPRYLGLVDTLSARGYPIVDLRNAFRGCGRCREAFAEHGHYSPEGNAAVAAYLGGLIPNRRP